MYAIHVYIYMHKYIYIHVNIYVCAVHYHDRCGRRLASTRHPYVHIHMYTCTYMHAHIQIYICAAQQKGLCGSRRVSAVADVRQCIAHKYKCIYEYICIHAHVQKLQNYLLVHTMNSRRGAGNVWRLWQLAV